MADDPLQHKFPGDFMRAYDSSGRALRVTSIDVAGSTVSVTSVTPGTGATNLGKAEDDPHSSGDVGVLALAVQKATPVNLGADGDYGPLQVSAGRLWVSGVLEAGSASIGILGANSGTDIGDVTINNAGGASAVNIQDGGNSITIDGSLTVANGSGTSAVYIQDGGNSITVDGTVALGAGTAAIGLVTVSNATGSSAVNVQDGGNSITVDGTVILGAGTAAIGLVEISNTSGASAVRIQDGGNSITIDGSVSLAAAIPAGTNSIGTVVVGNGAGSSAANIQDGGNTITVDGTVILGAGTAAVGLVEVSNTSGASAVRIQDGGNSITIDGSVSLAAAVPAGTNNIGFVTIVNATGSSAAYIRGDIASGSTDTDYPISIGGRCVTAEPATAAAGQRVAAWFDRFGRLVVVQGHSEEATPVTDSISATATASLIAAPGAGQSLHIASILASNMSTATGNLARCDFKDGSGGTIRVRGVAGINGGGFMWRPLRPWKMTANSALVAATSKDTADPIIITVEYFTAP